jgi:hypothetical protein
MDWTHQLISQLLYSLGCPLSLDVFFANDFHASQSDGCIILLLYLFISVGYRICWIDSPVMRSRWILKMNGWYWGIFWATPVCLFWPSPSSTSKYEYLQWIQYFLSTHTSTNLLFRDGALRRFVPSSRKACAQIRRTDVNFKPPLRTLQSASKKHRLQNIWNWSRTFLETGSPFSSQAVSNNVHL